VAVAQNGIIMVDGQYAPLHDKIKAAVATISNLPIKYLINTPPRRSHRRERVLRQGRVTIVAQDNVRKRLAAGTTNGLTGAKDAARAAGRAADRPYTNFSKVRLPGRVANLKQHPECA